MKAADRRRLEKLVAKWQPHLGLSEWQVEVLEDEPTVNDGRIAETSWDADLRVAGMRVKPKVVGPGPYEEHIVIHELLHLTDANRKLANLIHENPLLVPHLNQWFEQGLDDTARFLLKQSQAVVRNRGGP